DPVATAPGTDTLDPVATAPGTDTLDPVATAPGTDTLDPVATAFASDTRNFRGFAVKRLQLIQIDRLDVAPDAAFAERQSHPRFEVRNDLRLYLGMIGEIEVQSIRPRVHQGFQPCRTRLIFRFHVRRIDEHLHAQVAPDCRFAFRFSRAAN